MGDESKLEARAQMEIHFILTEKDYWNLTKNNFSRRRTLVSTGISLVALGGLLVVYVWLSPPGAVLTNLLSVVLPLLGLLLLVLFIRWRMRTGVKRNMLLQGEHIITISPEGLRYKTSLTDSLISWRAIKTINMDKYGIYFIRLSYRLMAHAIPRHAFATPEEAQAFLDLAQSYWVSGRVAPPA